MKGQRPVLNDIPGAPAGFLQTNGVGIAEGLPEAPALMLAVNEVALAARGQDADAEALQLTVADIVWRFPGPESLDPTLGEAGIWHGFPPAFCCRRGKLQLHFRPDLQIPRGKTCALSMS